MVSNGEKKTIWSPVLHRFVGEIRPYVNNNRVALTARQAFPRVYFKRLYKNAKSKVVTKNFQSVVFAFKRGVFQGDSMSPIIFILAFSPIIQDIQQNQDLGFEMNGGRIITLPYADDLCIITTNKLKHQKLIDKIEENTI